MHDPSPHARRREYLMDQAIRAGKFPPERRTHWAALYDRDPAGIEETLAMLTAATGLPALPPKHGHVRITRGSTSATSFHLPTLTDPEATSPKERMELTPEIVAGWSRQLFPETAAPAGRTRVRRAHD